MGDLSDYITTRSRGDADFRNARLVTRSLVELGNEISIACAKVGMDLSTLAARAGLSLAELADISCGLTHPPLEVLYTIADVLGMDLSLNLQPKPEP